MGNFILKISMRTLKLSAKLFTLFVLFTSILLLWFYIKIPSNKEIKGCLVTKMYQVHLCPGSKQYVRLGSVSNYVQKAVVVTEDSAFWQHHGFDFQEMQNSFKKNLEKGRFARGGSTITQQLAKNMFLTKDKTLSRKALEAIITVRLEEVLTKREILERYFNVVQFGKDIFGIQQAAHFYFKKNPSDLDVIESAFLVFLLPNPEVYSKSFYKKKLTAFASKRLEQIISRLYHFDRITQSEYLVAKNQLPYFLSGQQPPTIDPALDLIDEEDSDTELDLFE